jgi:hypothetical protein
LEAKKYTGGLVNEYETRISLSVKSVYWQVFEWRGDNWLIRCPTSRVIPRCATACGIEQVPFARGRVTAHFLPRPPAVPDKTLNQKLKPAGVKLYLLNLKKGYPICMLIITTSSFIYFFLSKFILIKNFTFCLLYFVRKWN